MNTAFTKKNKLGYWVGCLRYSNGVEAEVTNAFDHEWRALEVAERMRAAADQLDTERARFAPLNIV